MSGLLSRRQRRLRFWHAVVAVAALALVVRLAVIALTPQFVPVTDAADYDRIAVSIVQAHKFPPSLVTGHGGPTAFRPPLFPLSLSPVYEVVGVQDPQTRWDAGRVLEAVLGALAVALTCLIARRMFGDTTALISGGVAAVFPPLLLVGSSLMSEPLFIVLVLAAVLSALVHRRSRHRLRWAFLTGALVGCAALTRGNGFALILPIAFLLGAERPRSSWRALRAAAVAVAMAGVLLVPWTIRNISQLHAFVPVSTETGLALAGTYNTPAQNSSTYPALWIWPADAYAKALTRRGLNEAQLSARLTSGSLHFIATHPSSVARTALWNTIRLLNLSGAGVERYTARFTGYPAWLAAASVYAFWVVGLVALGGALTLAARRAPLAFWGCPVAIVLPAIPLLGATRYRAPADPFIVMLAALGAQSVWRRLRPEP